MRPFDHDLGADLSACLAPEPGDTRAGEVARTILALADAAASIAAVMARGPLAGALGAETGGANTDGDQQKHLDVIANDLVLEALRASGAAYYASEEEDAILTLDPAGALAVAVDPLDGSSNIDVNVSVGTIFSIFPASPLGATASFFRPGDEQLAAGYFIYGPHTALVMTTGHGTHMFALDPASRRFQLVRAQLAIPLEAREFAINASNYRHWFPPVRAFIDDCLVGAEGPRGKDFNMRWVGSLVAEAHRIFTRGGIFLYPGDRRPNYGQGRLRLIYEVFPMALLAEQAGGGASDGATRILDKVPGDLHERAALVFGSSRKVGVVAGYHTETTDRSENTSPLFGRRGLFRS